MRSLFLTVVYLLIIALGFQASYVWMLGYVWVDIFTPQLVAYSLLPSIPVSMILAVFVLFGLLRLPKDPDVVARSVTVLTVLLGAWMSLTLLWAEVPDAAFAKWNWAIKSVLFSCCVPYFLRNRIHIEAFLWTLVLSGIAHCLPFGAKVLISGGGMACLLAW
ncbi:O-antigen polymerase [Acidovorax delafieldii 2AN]|uniref:O-antigen polymerase n=1 Tax=Acidovorax delafieldii 2AN TaxID=573060 RepID=C5T0V4_ACIDE|nr:O-antigen polymerase [Acidovorax delafieldii 2AN]